MINTFKYSFTLVVLFFGLAPQTTPAMTEATPTSEWVIECIHCPHAFEGLTERSTQIDSTGKTHVAYGGKNLYYAQETATGEWDIIIVDDTLNVGADASLALDSSDYPYILYRKGSGFGYTHYDGITWYFEDLTQINNGTLVLDSAGNPHIITYDETDEDLVYWYQVGGSWTSEVVDSIGNVGSGYSIVIDSNDHLHVAYQDNTNSQLKYAYFDSVLWTLDIIDTYSHTPFISIDVDGSNYSHIATGWYDDFSSDMGEFNYFYQDSSGWHNEFISTNPCNLIYDLYQSNSSITLKIDSLGFAHIVYMYEYEVDIPEPPPSGLYAYKNCYLYQDAMGWQEERQNGGGFGVALQLDSTDTPYIYYATDASKLNQATYTPSGWVTSEIDKGDVVGRQLAIVISNIDIPHLSYAGLDDYAYYTTQIDGEWGYQHFATARWDSNLFDIAVTSTGDTHISGNGYDWLAPDGRYVWHRHNGIYLTLPNSLNYFGSRLVFSADDIGRLHAMVGSAYLVYVDGAWTEPVNTGLNSLDIVVDRLGRPHTIGEDSYATKEGDAWVVTEVDPVGGFSSLAVDLQNNPHIAYYDSTNTALKHAYYDGAVWQTEIVDNAGNVGQSASIGVDQFGGIHISYYDADNADLKYAYKTSSGWQTMTLVSEGEVGLPNVLAFDKRSHFPYIAYHDATTGDVKMVSRFEPVDTLHLPLVLR